MEIKFNIFISHDTSDLTIALELKKFLENIFLNSNVYVSGRDLEGGQTWIENIKVVLKSSQVIIALVSKNSIKSNWLHFESGAGFTDERTIPLITDNLSFNDLFPPLSLLQGRTLDAAGITQLISDIAKKINLRQPSHLPGIDDLISTIDVFLKERNKNSEEKVVVKPPMKIVATSPKSFDPEVLQAYMKLTQRTKTAVINKLLSVQEKYDIPPKEKLEGMKVSDLCGVASAYGIPTPSNTNLRLLSASLGLPLETDDKWKKVKVLKDFELSHKELDKYEAKT